ncbi:unnamed protein product, partial [Pylaiella littoralis]
HGIDYSSRGGGELRERRINQPQHAGRRRSEIRCENRGSKLAGRFLLQQLPFSFLPCSPALKPSRRSNAHTYIMECVTRNLRPAEYRKLRSAHHLFLLRCIRWEKRERQGPTHVLRRSPHQRGL